MPLINMVSGIPISIGECESAEMSKIAEMMI
jgi:hypothetical protein